MLEIKLNATLKVEDIIHFWLLLLGVYCEPALHGPESVLTLIVINRNYTRNKMLQMLSDFFVCVLNAESPLSTFGCNVHRHNSLGEIRVQKHHSSTRSLYLCCRVPSGEWKAPFTCRITQKPIAARVSQRASSWLKPPTQTLSCRCSQHLALCTGPLWRSVISRPQLDHPQHRRHTFPASDFHSVVASFQDLKIVKLAGPEEQWSLCINGGISLRFLPVSVKHHLTGTGCDTR